MCSAKKKSDDLCNKCSKKSDCDYKPTGDAVVIRCLDFVPKEASEEKK